MHRTFAFAAAIVAIATMPKSGKADGIPTLPATQRVNYSVPYGYPVTPPIAPIPVAPVYCARPAEPPPITATAYDRIMVEYYRCPSITGYRPGSVPEAGNRVNYSPVVDWSVRPAPVLQPAPRPPEIDAFPYRMQIGPAIFQYDSVTGAYIALSARDAQWAAATMAASIPQVMTPIPLTR